MKRPHQRVAEIALWLSGIFNFSLSFNGCSAFHGYYGPIEQTTSPPQLQAIGPPIQAAIQLSSDSNAEQEQSTSKKNELEYRSIRLAEVIQRAQESAFAVLEASARIEIASGKVQQKTAGLFPQVSLNLGGNYLHGRDINNAGEEIDHLSYPRYIPSAGLFYRINPGAVLTDIASARHQADADALALEDAKRNAGLQASIAYLDLALAYASVEISKQLVKDSERFVAIAQARAQAEIGSGSEVSRAQADTARAQLTQALAEERWEQSSIRLAVLLRWAALPRLIPAEQVIRPQALIDPKMAEQLQNSALANRPDILAQDARVKSANRQIKSIWWDILGPEIDAGAEQRLIGTEINDLRATTLAHVFLRLTFDLSDIGRLRSSRAIAETARIRQIELRERVQGHIEMAQAKVRSSLAAIAPAQVMVEASNQSYQSQLARFEAGTGLGIEIIEAQNARARAREALATAILRYNASQLELAANLGRFFPSETVHQVDSDLK